MDSQHLCGCVVSANKERNKSTGKRGDFVVAEYALCEIQMWTNYTRPFDCAECLVVQLPVNLIYETLKYARNAGYSV